MNRRLPGLTHPKMSLAPHELRELATLFSAGVSLHLACKKMSVTHPENPAWQRMETRVLHGQTFAQACEPESLFGPYHQEALRLAENSGQFESTLKRLASELEEAAAWRVRISGKLLYPFIIFAIMVALVSLANLFKLPANLALQKTLVNLGILYLLYALTRLFVRVLSQKADFWLPRFWRSRWMRDIGILQKIHDYHWLSLLCSQVSAGVDIASACQQMSCFQSSKTYQNAIRACLSNLQKGRGFAETIVRADLLFTPVMQRMLTLAENTGDWGSSIQHHLRTLEVDIRLFDAYLADWLPRFLYLLIIGAGFHVLR